MPGILYLQGHGPFDKVYTLARNKSQEDGGAYRSLYIPGRFRQTCSIKVEALQLGGRVVCIDDFRQDVFYGPLHIIDRHVFPEHGEQRVFFEGALMYLLTKLLA